MSTYSFLRWLREGAAAAVAATRSAAGPADRAAFGVQVNVVDDTGRTTTAFRTFTMFGPGDVIGLDARQILRSAPAPGAVDAEYEQFAHVEFDRPDLPWMFTPFHEERTEPALPPRPTGSPARALVTTGTLLPWLVLVVVEQRDGVTLGYRPGALLPVLHVDDASRELPELTQAHAFAHVQIAGELPTDASAFDRLLDGQPERTLSRLLCPRLLRPATGYLACLVPAFEAGRLAGLGEEVTGVPAAAPAWDRAKATPVDLPVYHHWTFTTAADAGFETLVRRLVPRGDLPGVGVRPLDVSSPGFGLPPAPVGASAMVEVGGALRVPLAPPPAGADADLRDAIADVVDRVDRVAPPMYGRWHAAVAAVPRGTDDPAWLRRLNTEPALRVAAGLGTRVVQADQEALMAAAWEQLGEVLRANQLLRQGQLALHVSGRVYSRHIAPLPQYALLQLAGPALPRLRAVDGIATIRGRVAASCLPLVTLHASFRRVVRPGGPLFRRATRGADRPADRLSVERLLESLMNGGLPATAPPPPVPTVALTATDRAVVSAALGAGGAGPEQQARARVGAALAVLAARTAGACTPATEDLAAIARQRLTPAQTVPARVTAQLTLPAGLWDPGPGLDPVMAAPELPAPMYLPLVEQGQDWLLPGLEHVPPNTAAGLEANSEFIEAYLVGLNAEMCRELLWRGYPTDQRGTVFSRFFDLRGPGERFAAPWINAIDGWEDEDLGGHRPAGAPTGLVLLVRGDLVRRFPRPGITLVRAQWLRAEDGTVRRHLDGRPMRGPVEMTPATVQAPLFGGRLEPDVLFLGFATDAVTARGAEVETGDPGWFILFQEQPTEPRFVIAALGAKPDPVTGRLRSWHDLSRDQVRTDSAGHLDLELTDAAAPFRDVIPAAPAWDGRSDTLAAVTLYRPFRLFLHAGDLLPAPTMPTPVPEVRQ